MSTWESTRRTEEIIELSDSTDTPSAEIIDTTPPVDDDAAAEMSSSGSRKEPGQSVVDDPDKTVSILMSPKPRLKELTDPWIGAIINNYEILERVGEGGMSVVYKANHLGLRKHVAVKMLLPHLVANASSLQRFQQEAQAASTLTHPAVVTVLDYGVFDGRQPYLVMDLLKGQPLSAIIKNEGRMPAAKAVGIFIQICDALAHAHDLKIIHRDLKPSNIILESQNPDRIKIVDFGIAKIMPHEGADAIALTQTGEVFGSPLYMSPEQCKGEKLDGRSDIYSMGCLMYELLCGSPPISGSNMLEILYRHINETPQEFKKVAKNAPIPKQLEAIVFKALAKDPADRYQSMRALEEDLERFAGEQSSGFLGRAAATWKLQSSRRRRLGVRERIALAIATISVIAGGIACGSIGLNYWNAENLPILRGTPVWYVEPRVIQTLDQGGMSAVPYYIRTARNQAADEHAEVTNQDLWSYSSAAEKLFAMGKYNRCLEIVTPAVVLSQRLHGIQAMPTLNIQRLKGLCYLELHKWKEAQMEFEALIEPVRGSGAQVYDVFATVAGELGDAYYFDAMVDGKPRPGSMDLLGKASTAYMECIQAQVYHDSRAVQRRAAREPLTAHPINETPANALVLARLGDIYRFTEHYEQAHKHYDLAGKIFKKVSDNRNLAVAAYLDAFVLRKLHQLEDASERFKTALGCVDPLSPDAAQMWFAYSELASARGDMATCLDARIHAWKIATSPKSRKQ